METRPPQGYETRSRGTTLSQLLPCALDILPVMATLNRFFQWDYISLASMQPCVLMTRGQLQDLRSGKGNEKKLCIAVETTRTKEKDLLMSTNVHTTQQEIFFIIHCLVENLDPCFPAAELDVVMALGKVFSIQRYRKLRTTQKMRSLCKQTSLASQLGTTLLPSFLVTN